MSLTFHGIDHRIISKVEVMRQLEEIIAANATAQQETLFDVCEYLRGRSYTQPTCGSIGSFAEISGETTASVDLSTVFRKSTAQPAVCPSLNIFHGEIVTERKSVFHAHMVCHYQLAITVTLS
jgi:hypothetical protein